MSTVAGIIAYQRAINGGQLCDVSCGAVKCLRILRLGDMADILSFQLGTFGRAKRKVDELQRVIAESRRVGGH
jgi:hypothetical protein